MSYKTSSSQVFPEIPQQPQNTHQVRQRMQQDFTAIQVGDPHADQDKDSHQFQVLDGPPRRRSPPVDRDNGSRSKLDDLVSRQDQLLQHQQQVSHRQNEIADHMRNQNQKMNETLIKQVLANKEDMIAQLNQQQANDWDSASRDLLQQHIKYMVAIIRRLSTDIEGLESELRGRDIAVIGTNKAVNKLEVHHVTMLHDLRGRIVRCDTAIAKHTKDIIMVMEELRRKEGLIFGTREKLTGDIHRLEAEVMSITSELERQNGEQRSAMNHMNSDAIHRITMLEDRQKARMAEIHGAIDSNRDNIDHYMEKMDAKFKAMIDKATAGWGDMMSRVDARTDQNMMSILSRLKRLEEQMSRDKQNMKTVQQNVETQVIAVIQDSLDYQNAELAKAKNEFRNGFTELQESLANMKRVVEGRRKLMGHQVNKELGMVKKALFMEMPPQEQPPTTFVVRNVDRSMEW